MPDPTPATTGPSDVLVFVDANALLDFYRMPLPLSLLEALVQARNNILITAQVRGEVERNRVEVAYAQLAELAKRPLTKLSVPDVLLRDLSPADGGPTIVKLLREHAEGGTQAKRALDDLIPALVQSVAAGSDPVSVRMAPLLEAAVSPTEDELERARRRKESGNPPGKKGDPLGDQLSWEQVLTALSRAPKLIVVSRDGDFGTLVDRKTRVPNAVLLKDATDAGAMTVVLAHDLREALAMLADELKVALNVPSAEDVRTAVGRDLPLYEPGRPGGCPRCGKADTFLNGAYLRSQHGGLTWQYICGECHYHLDTGDHWD